MPIKATILLILVTTFFVQAQQSGILIENIKTHKEKFISENKRILIKTLEGKKYIGNYKILNDSIITINENIIEINSVIKIKKRSIFSSITRPIMMGTGCLFLISGGIGAVSGGYGLIATIALVPPGTLMLMLPILSNNHLIKEWKYKIVLDTK